jgi:hypothetical protein
LFGLIIPSPKLNDLRRDGRYALNSETFPPPRHDHALYLTGTAAEVADPVTWNQVAAQFLTERGLEVLWPGFEDQVLFEFEIERCLLTLTAAEDGLPAGHTLWVAGEALEMAEALRGDRRGRSGEVAFDGVAPLRWSGPASPYAANKSGPVAASSR